jgi:hypothetical protein
MSSVGVPNLPFVFGNGGSARFSHGMALSPIR